MPATPEQIDIENNIGSGFNIYLSGLGLSILMELCMNKVTSGQDPFGIYADLTLNGSADGQGTTYPLISQSQDSTIVLSNQQIAVLQSLLQEAFAKTGSDVYTKLITYLNISQDQTGALQNGAQVSVTNATGIEWYLEILSADGLFMQYTHTTGNVSNAYFGFLVGDYTATIVGKTPGHTFTPDTQTFTITQGATTTLTTIVVDAG